MARYTGYHSILDAVLGEYRSRGFELVEDEHLLYLFRNGERVAVFSSSGATVESVRRACEECLAG